MKLVFDNCMFQCFCDNDAPKVNRFLCWRVTLIENTSIPGRSSCTVLSVIKFSVLAMFFLCLLPQFGVRNIVYFSMQIEINATSLSLQTHSVCSWCASVCECRAMHRHSAHSTQPRTYTSVLCSVHWATTTQPALGQGDYVVILPPPRESSAGVVCIHHHHHHHHRPSCTYL